MQADLATLQAENERQQMIITALAEQNRQLLQQVKQLQALLTNTSHHNHPNVWIQSDASNQENQKGWIQPNASNQENQKGCIQPNASNLENQKGWIQPDASNLRNQKGWIQSDTSNPKNQKGWIQPDTSNQEIKKEGLHPNAVHFATLPQPLQIDMALFKRLLQEAGVGITRVSLASSAAILWFCVQQPLHSSAKLMALTGFSEGGVSKRLIALKKLQLLYRGGYQYYTLTPKAIALVQKALV